MLPQDESDRLSAVRVIERPAASGTWVWLVRAMVISAGSQAGPYQAESAVVPGV